MNHEHDLICPRCHQKTRHIKCSSQNCQFFVGCFWSFQNKDVCTKCGHAFSYEIKNWQAPKPFNLF